MGIPKYFRYISQRWPTISQLVNDSVIPEFDNLYLDMNSILHNCTHKDAGHDVTSQLTEREMFIAIFNYIEHLFNVIVPQKVFYMAIDGVAPRAKMNQQRSRRFRSALDAENARKEALRKGVEMPKNEPFDSNAITPGTEFMARVTEQLKYFISRKVSEDARWQSCRIILSGHEVPGEGEHKIMNFIRGLRSDPEWNPNTRHCLYGLDADLIMLGLSTHEPHFALLREEVTFGRQVRFQSAELSEKRFFLLHLSLVREYLQLEMMEGIEDLDLEFDRMLDDFIIINFFIGNDFLPELPMLMVNDGAVPVILSTYKTYITESMSYISHNGVIDFQNLRKWMIELSGYQTDKFEAESQDGQWFSNQLDLISGSNDSHRDDLMLTANQKSMLRAVKPAILEAATSETGAVDLSNDIDEPKSSKDISFLRLVAEQTQFVPESPVKWVQASRSDWHKDRQSWLTSARKILRVYEKAPEASTGRQELYDLKFRQWRDRYYSRKFKATGSSELIGDVVHNYLEGLQWVLLYYYRGCPSWGWYYRYHYSPMTTELINGIGPDFKLEFELGEPFTPFEQLMGVLPDRSVKIIPPALRDLVLDETSPIHDFYPHTFELDKNGKKADWEAVVLIPFIDEKRLLHAVRPREEHQLSEDERRRNTRGTDLEFLYDAELMSRYPSTIQGAPDIEPNHCVIQIPHYPNFPLRYGIFPDTKQGVHMMAGFPSLHTISYEWSVEKAGVRVFEQEFRGESVAVDVKPSAVSKEPLEELKKRLVGSNVYVEWPFLREARVTAVTGRDSRDDAWTRGLAPLSRKYANHGVRIGDTKVMVHYKLLKGLVKHRDGSFRKEFGGEEGFLPLQLVVDDIEDEDERFRERAAVPVSEEYPDKSPAIVLLSKFFGAPATVRSTGENVVNIDALHYVIPETKYGNYVAHKERETVQWLPLGAVARRLNSDPGFVAQLTSRFLVTASGQKADIGVCIRKPAMSLMAEGYARPGQRGGWEFSERGISLIEEYCRTFPDFAKRMRNFKYRPGPPPDVFVVMGTNMTDTAAQTAVLKQVQAVRKWLHEKLDGVAFVPTTTHHMDTEFVRDIESKVIERERESGGKNKANLVAIDNLPRDSLLSPATAHHQLRRQDFRLGNRIVSALNYGAVPLFSRGTVIGINGGPGSSTVDVLWDHEFAAGNSLDGRLQTKRGLTVSTSSVLNLSVPQLLFARGEDTELLRAAEALSVSNKSSGNAERRGQTQQRKFAPAPARNDWNTSGSRYAALSAAGPVPSAGKPAPETPGTKAKLDAKTKPRKSTSPKASNVKAQVPAASTTSDKTPKVASSKSATKEGKSPRAAAKSKTHVQSEPAQKQPAVPAVESNDEGKQLLDILQSQVKSPAAAAEPASHEPVVVEKEPEQQSENKPIEQIKPQIPQLQARKRNARAAAAQLLQASL